MTKRKLDSKLVPAKRSKPGHWSLGLTSSIDDPELFVKSDNLVNVIKDKYPKAEFHYLVICKEDINSLKSVTSKQNNLLQHMENVGIEIAKDKKHKGKTFNLGYHAEPSMSRLHLHVISDDMNSDCLKNKKHWNSFTTKFFLKSEDVRKSLKDNNNIILPSKEDCKKLIGSDLKCHKCDFKPKNMPDLKKHILTHLK